MKYTKVEYMPTHFSMVWLFTSLVSFSVLVQAQPAATQTKTPPQAEPKDAPLPPLPANRKPLPLVGGDGSAVTKTASVPGLRVPLPGPVPSVGVCGIIGISIGLFLAVKPSKRIESFSCLTRMQNTA